MKKPVLVLTFAILSGCAGSESMQSPQSLAIVDYPYQPWMLQVHECMEGVGRRVDLKLGYGGVGYVKGPEALSIARCLEKRGWILEHQPGDPSARIRPPE